MEGEAPGAVDVLSTHDKRSAGIASRNVSVPLSSHLETNGAVRDDREPSTIRVP